MTEPKTKPETEAQAARRTARKVLAIPAPPSKRLARARRKLERLVEGIGRARSIRRQTNRVNSYGLTAQAYVERRAELARKRAEAEELAAHINAALSRNE